MNSFLRYLGGKSRLVSTIVPLIPEHRTYAEVFCGAAWILFGKEESKVEAINDINLDLINLFRCVQNHLDELVRYFRWSLVSRDEYQRVKQTNPEVMTDIQRAVRFLYLQKLGYAGKPTEHYFSASAYQKPTLNLLRLEETLSQAHLRLARVWIERLPYEKFVERYDTRETFLYLDPPYDGSEDDYGKGIFTPDDFERMRDLLRGIEGKFMVSLNNTKKVRMLFGEFNIREVKTSYQTQRKREEVKELLIMNYEQ